MDILEQIVRLAIEFDQKTCGLFAPGEKVCLVHPRVMRQVIDAVPDFARPVQPRTTRPTICASWSA